MKRQTIILLVVFITATTGVSAQDRTVIRRPPCGTWCQILGTPPPPFERVVPLNPRHYAVPRSVGINVQIPSPSPCQVQSIIPEGNRPLEITMRDMVDKHGISAVGLLLDAHPTDNHYENIRKAFRTPGIDVIVFRPSHWQIIEKTCIGRNGYTLEPYPLELFEMLYQTYANQEKQIFVQNIEADWQMHGIGCRTRNECPGMGFYGDACLDACEAGDLVEYDVSAGESCAVQCCDMEKIERGEYLLRTFNARQAAAEAARAAHPDATLKVWHSIEVNFYGNRDWQFRTILCDIIPRMDSPPDFIGLSIYNMADDPVVALDYAMACTHLPAWRFFISEVGAQENNPGDQAEAIHRVVNPLFALGVPFALVWSLEDSTSWPTGYSVIDINTGEKLSGYTAIQELNATYRNGE